MRACVASDQSDIEALVGLLAIMRRSPLPRVEKSRSRLVSSSAIGGTRLHFSFCFRELDTHRRRWKHKGDGLLQAGKHVCALVCHDQQFLIQVGHLEGTPWGSTAAALTEKCIQTCQAGWANDSDVYSDYEFGLQRAEWC